MTFEKQFEALKAKFDKADLKKFDEDFAFQVNMTDDDCHGIFYIAYIGGEYTVAPFDYVDHTALIVGPAKEIAKLASGTVGKIEVSNSDKAAAQVAAFAKSFKKPAAKKPAAKKPAAKKPAPAKKEEAKVEQLKLETPAKTEAPKAAEPAKKACAKKPCAKKAEPAKK